jgi:peptidoglycan/LPS O-acetylase OafA/YrhL
MPTKERIFGLDLLRATAVLLVVFHHSLILTKAPDWLSSVGWVGEIGVGALLVLSGYLIGQGLIKKTRDGRFLKLGHLGQFYMRRWLRTLPPYYFYLAVMAALFPPFIAELLTHKAYFFFLQNFAWNVSPFYAQTWTLALLEFFYFLFPLLLFVTGKFVRNYLFCLAVPMALLFFVPLALRAMHTQIETPLGFEETFRKWVVFRLDTPIIGVAAALVQSELPLLWAWFLHRTWIGLCTFCGVVLYHFFGCPYLYSNHWIQVFFYPVSALALAPLLPFLCNWKFNQSLLGTALSTVSQTSYSLYVSHIFALSIGFCLLFMLGVPHGWWFAAYPLDILLMVVITCASYYLTEEPFIRLRENNSGSLIPAFYNAFSQAFNALFGGWTFSQKRSATPLGDQPPA